MDTCLFHLADRYFERHPELVVGQDNNSISGMDDHLFIHSEVVEGRGFRTISECLVLYMMRYSGGNCIQYLFSPNAAIKVVMPSLPSVDLHRHHYFELFGVLDGQLDVQTEYSIKRYYPGEFCLLNKSIFHSERFAGEYSAMYLSLRTDFFENLVCCPDASHYETFRQFADDNLKELGNKDSLDFSPVNGKSKEANLRVVDDILCSILSELLGRHTGYMDIISGLLKRLMAHLQHPDNFTCVDMQYSGEKADICQEALAYIHQARRKLTRQELGAALNYNGNYLARVFRTHMGVSLPAYIRDVCMQEAARLLLNTPLPIYVIADSVGYENRTVFYQHFRAKYHLSPSEFRDGIGPQKGTGMS